MAKIWPVYEGKEPTRGGPWADIPLSEAIDLCELRPSDFISDLTAAPRPRFGDIDRDLWYAGFKHVVVEIEHDEGQKRKWKPGFYKSQIKPKEAFRRLIQQPLVATLGKDNVVRVQFEPSTDSQGSGAIKITVVIAPGAAPKLANGPIVDALVRLQERLGEMRIDRTPIVEYATEAELAQDGGP